MATLAVYWTAPSGVGIEVAYDQSLVLTSSVAYTGPVQSSGYRWRVAGTTPWSALLSGGNGSTIMPANTLPGAGTYEIVRFGLQQDGSYGEAIITVKAKPSSPTPTISAPSGTVTSPSTTVTWTTSPTTQTKYQVQVLDAASMVILFDSGEVNSASQSMTGVPFPDTGVNRIVRVRIDRGAVYAWGLWGSATVAVTHTPPVTPTITALDPVDPIGIGCNHMLLAQIDQPAQGAAPAVVLTEMYVRRSGDRGDGVLVASLNEQGASGATTYYYPSPTTGVLYELRARNVSADGRSAYSAWQVASDVCAIVGVVLSEAHAGSDGTNLLPNPGFEVDTTGWSGSSGTISSVADATGPEGAKAAAFVSTVATPGYMASVNFPVIAGEIYALSAWLKLQVTQMGYRAILPWFSLGGAAFHGQLDVATPSASLTGSAFRRLVPAVGEVPSFATSTRVQIQGSTAIPVSSGFRLDGVSLIRLPYVRMFRFNGDEASDDYQPERALIQYDGRPFPVVEYGTASTRDLQVTIDMKTDADVLALRRLLLSRKVLLYRDRRGRNIYCTAQAGGIQDTAYGYRATLTITAVDFPYDRSA